MVGQFSLKNSSNDYQACFAERFTVQYDHGKKRTRHFFWITQKLQKYTKDPSIFGPSSKSALRILIIFLVS